MDHNWGVMIHRYGLSGAGTTLAARLLGSPVGAIQVLTNDVYSPGLVTAYVLPYLAIDYYTSYGLPIVTRPHFPYGYAVEPDFPV